MSGYPKPRPGEPVPQYEKYRRPFTVWLDDVLEEAMMWFMRLATVGLLASTVVGIVYGVSRLFR